MDEIVMREIKFKRKEIEELEGKKRSKKSINYIN
jgi:hypothetical protein